MDENFDLISRVNKLPRRACYDNVDYVLIIYKNETEFRDDAWILYYAKLIKKGFSTSKPLIEIQGKTFDEAFSLMQCAVDQFILEHKGDPKLTFFGG